jgi:hypothetical protein
MKKKKLKIFEFVAVLAVALVLELFVFNFSYFRGLLDNDIAHNLNYDIGDFEVINWDEDDGVLVSRFDPQLVLNGINTEIKDICITAKADADIPYAVLFYTDETYPVFTGDAMLTIQGGNGNVFKADPDWKATDLRIDLGDDAGLRLTGLDVEINPLKINISISRIIAIFIIYYGAKFLFSLQRSPDYGLNVKQRSEGENGREEDK